MKKIYRLISILLATSLMMIGCDPADKFNNPEKTEIGSVPALFTSMLNNARMRTEYWNVRTVLITHQAIYTQTVTLVNSSSLYKQNDSYLGQYWRDFYTAEYGGAMGMYRQMQRVANDLPSDQQAENEIFFQAGKVVMYDFGSQLVDMFGDIPFSEAGSLSLTAQNVPAKFDDQQELYKMFIEDLDKVATYFSTAATTTSFTRQDIMLAGSVKKWQKYANSIRLRLLIHISNVEEGYAKQEIMNMLNNPAKYPLIDGDNNGNYDPKSVDVLNVPLTTYTSNLYDALNEGYASLAPDFMVNNLMVPTEDVRLPVMFDKNGQDQYVAAPITATSESLADYKKVTANWDSVSIWQNNKLPGIRITASEINLIKAEAYERWGSSADAKTAYETAVKQSVSFYFYLNSINLDGDKETKPSDQEINDFISTRITYQGTRDQKLELIGTQKWLHLGFLQGLECWTELRRTKYPTLLPFPSEGKENGFETPPTRLLYPSLERNTNPNYSTVQSKDTRTTKIFWDVN